MRRPPDTRPMPSICTIAMSSQWRAGLVPRARSLSMGEPTPGHRMVDALVPGTRACGNSDSCESRPWWTAGCMLHGSAYCGMTRTLLLLPANLVDELGKTRGIVRLILAFVPHRAIAPLINSMFHCAPGGARPDFSSRGAGRSTPARGPRAIFLNDSIDKNSCFSFPTSKDPHRRVEDHQTLAPGAARKDFL